MNALTQRIRRLESRFGPGDSEGILLVVSRDDRELALDENKCVQILRECGFLRTGGGIHVVNLGKIPDGLNAEETERFLKEKGTEICGPRVLKNMMDGQAGLRKEARRGENDHQTGFQTGGAIRCAAR